MQLQHAACQVTCNLRSHTQAQRLYAVALGRAVISSLVLTQECKELHATPAGVRSSRRYGSSLATREILQLFSTHGQVTCGAAQACGLRLRVSLAPDLRCCSKIEQASILKASEAWR